MNSGKGQAAMEYLMTYGWALLAIVIVIAALIYLNPFRGPEFCLPRDPSFGCNEPTPQFYAEGSNAQLWINARLTNNLGRSLLIKEAACTDAAVSEISKEEATPVPEDYQLLTSKGYLDGSLKCIKADGSELLVSPGQQFRGTIIVWYNYKDEIDQSIRHEAQLDLSGAIVQGTPPSKPIGGDGKPSDINPQPKPS